MPQEVELRLKINRNQLGQDAEAAARRIKQAFGDLGIDVDLDTARARRELDDFGREANSILQGIGQGIGQGALDLGIDLLRGAIDGIGDLAGSTLELGAAAEQSEIAFATMLGSAERGQQAIASLTNFAATTPFELPGVLDSGRQLLAFGFELEELETQLGRVGNVAAGVNQPFNELANIYGKARVQGRLFAEDINQLTERGIPIIQELAKQFGVSESEVRKLVETGQVGFQNLEQAFISLTSEGGKFFNLMEAQSQSVGGQLTNLSDKFQQAQVAGFNAFSPALAGGVDLLNSSLERVAARSENLSLLEQAAADLGKELGENDDLARALGNELAEVADLLIGQIADGMESLTNFLRENPELVRQMVEGMGDFLERIINATAGVLKIAGLIGGVVAEVKGFVDGISQNPIIERLLDAGGNIASFATNPSNAIAQGGIDALANFGARDEGSSRAGGGAGLGEGLDSITQLAEESLKANNRRVESAIKAGDDLVKAEAESQKAALQAFTQAQDQKTQLLEQSSNDQIAGILRRGRLEQQSEEQIQQEIERIQLRAGDQVIAQKESELNQLSQLRAQGTIDAEEAAKREADLAVELSQLKREQEEQLLAFQRQAAEERIRLQFDPVLQGLRGQGNALDASTAGLRGELEELSALQGVQQSLQQLEQERLNTQILSAELAKDEVGAEQLKGDLLRLQAEQSAEQFKADQESLNLKLEIAEAEKERALVSAQIAANEAQLNALLAEAAGESQRQIDLKREAAALAQQQVDLAEQDLERQSRIADAQREKLNVEREVSKEREKQAQLQQQAAQADAGLGDLAGFGGGLDSGGGGSLGGGGGRNFSLEQGENPLLSQRSDIIGAAAQRTIDQQLAFSRSFLEAGNRQLAGFLGVDLSQLQQPDQQALVQEVKGLRGDLQAVAARPSQLTIESNDPAGDIGRAVSQLSRNRVQRSRI